MSFLRSLLPSNASVLNKSVSPLTTAVRFNSSLLVPLRTRPNVFGPTGKAATALFSAAMKQNNINKVRSDLLAFQTVYNNSNSLKIAFMDPCLSAAQRTTVVNKQLDSHNIKSKEARDFIFELHDSKLLPKINQVVSDFEVLAKYSNREVQAVVTSAEPLTPQQVTRLQSALKSRIAPEYKLVITQKVDASIMGGLVVDIENKLLDMSVATKIKSIDAKLRNQ